VVGTVLKFDGMTRTGVIEGPGEYRYFFTFFGSGVLLKNGDEVTFDGCVDNTRRTARNISKVQQPVRTS